MGRHEAQTLPQAEPLPVPLDDQIRRSLAGVADMRNEIARLQAQLTDAERQVLVLDTENHALRIQLENERNERSYYHRFAIEITTSLNLIAQVTDDVMSKAQQAAMQVGAPNTQLPDIEIPKWLKAKHEHDRTDLERDIAEVSTTALAKTADGRA